MMKLAIYNIDWKGVHKVLVIGGLAWILKLFKKLVAGIYGHDKFANSGLNDLQRIKWCSSFI